MAVPDLQVDSRLRAAFLVHRCGEVGHRGFADFVPCQLRPTRGLPGRFRRCVEDSHMQGDKA